MPQERRPRRRRSPPGRSCRRRLGELGASLAGSVAELDSSSANSGADGAAPWPRYQALIASRLDILELPPSAEGDDPGAVDRRDLTPGEVLQTLTRRSFPDDEMLHALVEYQVQKCLNTTHVRDSGEFPSASKVHRRDSGEFHSSDADMVAVDSAEVFSYEDYLKDCKKLKSRRILVDEDNELDGHKLDELFVRHARIRIKALLLLKGKAIDKLDDAALERKYPPSLIAQHSYLLGYERHNAFGWFFDYELCKLADLTDYQRLVLFNDCGDEYINWSNYRLFYNTPETDRQYLLYWEALTVNLKWIEHHIHRRMADGEWENLRLKVQYQAIRIATDFDNIHADLAFIGFLEFMLNARNDVLFLKDLDGVFFEIWRLVIKGQVCFKNAVKQVYEWRMFPSRELCMKDEVDSRFGGGMENLFLLCTDGITEKVPEDSARELIAQQVKAKLVAAHGYHEYAAKKLKVAEYIGLISKSGCKWADLQSSC